MLDGRETERRGRGRRRDRSSSSGVLAAICLLAIALVTALGSVSAAGADEGCSAAGPGRPCVTISATPNPVALNGTLELNSKVSKLSPTTTYDVIFFRLRPGAEPIAEGHVQFETDAAASDVTANLLVAPPGVGQFQYFGRAQETANPSAFSDSPIVTVTVVGDVTVAAEPASKLFPRFQARVSPVAPATFAPTGTVAFQVRGQTVCTASVDASGEASCQGFGVFLANTYTAVYSGSAVYPPASDTGSLTLSLHG